MNKTLIERVKNPDGTQGYTWNPITGCLNHLEGMCKGGNFPCYAYRLANTRLRERYLANKNTAPTMGNILLPNLGFVEMNPFYPRFWPERLWEPRSHRKEAGIFACDMSDLFGEGIPEEWTRQVLRVCQLCSWHRFYLLTKRPENLIKFSPFPDNCWVGVTACNEAMWTEALWRLSKIQATVKYISIEPSLKGIPQYVGGIKNCGINWLIIGAQTKPYKPPKIEWVQEIVEAADKAGIPVFLKDNLKPLIYEYTTIKDTWCWAKDKAGWFIRQEIPK